MAKESEKQIHVYVYGASPGGSLVKNRLPMQEMWFRSLGGEDPLGKEMTPHSSILTWKIPWTEELQS